MQIRLLPLSVAIRSILLRGVLAAALMFAFASPSRADVIYVVKSGDSAWSIATHFGVSMEDLYTANGWAPDSDPVLQIGQGVTVPTPKKAELSDSSNNARPTGSTYTVQAGDTPFHIAHQFHVNVADFMKYNGLTDADIIRIGQVLKIPPDDSVQVSTVNTDLSGVGSGAPPIKYKVLDGDNDWSIAQKFGVSVDRLLALNHLGENPMIHAGDELLIPAPDSSPQSRSLG